MKRIKRTISFVTIIVCIVFLQFSMVFSAEHLDASLHVMRLINDVRQTPLNALPFAGIDRGTAQVNLGMDAWVLDQGLPPVAWNSLLHASALAHANDMITNLYYAYNSLNGDTVQDRIASTGFDYIVSGESLGILSFDRYIAPELAAKAIVDNMVAYELGGTILSSNRNILSHDRTEMGVAFVSAVVDLGLNVPVNIYLVVVDFARSVHPRSFIIGNVSLLTPDSSGLIVDNTLPGVNLVLRDLLENTDTNLVSGPLGFFQFEMPFGFVLLEARDDATGDLLAWKNLFGQSENQLIDLFIDR